MTGTVVFLGDPLHISAPWETREVGNPRTLVWVCDLRTTGDRRSARKQLKQASLAMFDACRVRQTVRHLLVAYTVQASCSASTDHVAWTLAIRLHTQLELRLGRDIDVVFINISNLDDQKLLYDRAAEWSSQLEGLAGAAVLDWGDIRNESIRRAANQAYL